MDFTILRQYRADTYACLTGAADALFNLADALLTETQAHSPLELTLSPLFERKWPSFYQALSTGSLNQARFEQTLVNYAPPPAAGERLVLAVDASNIERPLAETSPDRGWLYKHNLPECDKPVVPGWQFSVVVVVPAQTSSHTYIVSNRRIPTNSTPAEVAAAQLHQLRPYFKQRPINLGDRYYPTKQFIADTRADYDLLLRVKANRVFYRAAPVKTHQRGAPATHGPRWQGKDATTHGSPSREWQGWDETGHKLEVSEWQGLHQREDPQTPLSVIRVRRYGASGKARDPLESWFCWVGQQPLPLEAVWPTYRRRYSIEHGFRFDKQDLLWTQPHLRYPAQFELWTALVSLVHNELQLAAGLSLAVLRPWESSSRQASPQQIRRGLAAIMDELGSPAKPSKVRGKGPGRAFGAKVSLAPRYAVVKKGPERVPKRAKTG